LAEELEALLELGYWDEELFLAENSLFLGTEDKLIVFAHNDCFFRAHFFAEAAVDATEHVDFELLRVAFLLFVGLSCTHFDGKRWTYT
jgi:hypothetical protein